MPRRISNPQLDSLSPEQRKRELTRMRTKNYRANNANPDNVRRALVAATALCSEDTRRQVLDAMMATLDEDKRDEYSAIAHKLLNLPDPSQG